MRFADLAGKKVIVWGGGREGQAAVRQLRRLRDAPEYHLVAEEGDDTVVIDGRAEKIVTDLHYRRTLLQEADVVIKSPGISLYHPEVQALKRQGVQVTSLLRLWLAEPKTAKVICVTGTKGKSTTSSMLAHALNGIGQKTVLAGNIGVPITDVSLEGAAFVVVETSSYQAADIEEKIDVAVVTSLYEDHVDWHRGVENYHRDKLNLLRHATYKILSQQAAQRTKALPALDTIVADDPAAIHVQGTALYDGTQLLGSVHNSYLARAHNLANMALVLTVIKHLGLDTHAAIPALESFQGLPHRQQELGTKNGLLYVDDSIATMPQAAIAAMEHYASRPVTLIAGGFDRGIDYAPLTDYIRHKNIHAVIVMGPSGERILQALQEGRSEHLYRAASMPEAVATAQRVTPEGGVVLLSPAAPSYGLFKDFVERGKAFAEAIAL